MKVIKINKSDWASGLDKSRKSYKLYGPAKARDKNFGEFRLLGPDEQPDLSLADTRMSPKSIAFPDSEVMFEYSMDEKAKDCNILKRPEKDYSPRAVIGIRPYDAAAFLLVKKNYDTPEYRDPYWCDAYEACTFIGLAITHPQSTDFSTSTKSGPFDESGLDVLLVDCGDYFLAKEVTEKGAAFLSAAGWTEVADHGMDEIEKLKAEAEARIRSKISFDNIQNTPLMTLYEADFWEDIAFSCINCGTCTYVCPTCWCFDIQDETFGKTGIRCKNWDSCMYPLFTLHASTHNPRPEKYMRVRQRFMHKLKYFLDKYNDGIMCVGCGRCIRSCPVNIDIRKVCELMNSVESSSSACAVSS